MSTRNRRSFIKNLAVASAAVPLLSFGKTENEATPPATMKIQRLSWAGIKIEVNNTTLFVDATVGEKEAPLSYNTEYKYALITHAHGDHFDSVALKNILDKRSLLICHKDVTSWIDTRDFRIHALNLYEPIILARANSDIVAIPVPAVDGFGLTQVSWVIDGGGKRIIHCGDTAWHGYWWDISRVYGPFDMAFLPINGARQINGRITDTGVPAVLTPAQALAAAKVLRVNTVCPIHYGGASDGYFEVNEPEKTFASLTKESNIKVITPKYQEWISL